MLREPEHSSSQVGGSEHSIETLTCRHVQGLNTVKPCHSNYVIAYMNITLIVFSHLDIGEVCLQTCLLT